MQPASATASRFDTLSGFGATRCQTTPANHVAIMDGVLRSDEAIFNEALCERVRSLRKDRGWTAEQMATALGIPADRYRKYEYRSPLPHYLIERFALIVGRDVEFVLTGRAQVAELQRRIA